jgi:hypothetical protein
MLRAGDVQRQQLKWFVWASALVLIAGAIDALLTGPWLPIASIADAAWVLFTFAAITLPIAALIAILRHGLYDIDRLIGRTFVYGALTAILAGMYAASMRLFEAVFKDVTGQTSDAALVITTLVLATTFAPIKARLEKVVDRRLGPAHDPRARHDVRADQGPTGEGGRPPPRTGGGLAGPGGRRRGGPAGRSRCPDRGHLATRGPGDAEHVARPAGRIGVAAHWGVPGRARRPARAAFALAATRWRDR